MQPVEDADQAANVVDHVREAERFRVDATLDGVDHAVVVDEVHRRRATGGGDPNLFPHGGIPTIEFGFGTQTAHGTDEYTTAEAPTRNAVSDGTLPILYEQLGPTD